MNQGRFTNSGAAVDPHEAAVAEQVGTLLAGSQFKQAVELAKNQHGRKPTATSEKMLVDAYLARIRNFQTKGAMQDASTLIKLVHDRFPAHRSALRMLEIRAAGSLGRFDEVLRPLAQGDLQPELRDTIETIVRTDCTDLQALADCKTLPADHSLRKSASAVLAALKAATSGPVAEEQISLPEISRRSPLAGWKMLVRAIAAFYRNDDDGCRRALEGIAPDSAVQRLAQVLGVMLDKPQGKSSVDVRQTKAGAALASRVAGGDKPLRDALVKLESAFAGQDLPALTRAMRDALAACSTFAPDRLDKLRQHISVRCTLLDVPVNDVLRTMGQALHDAYFWRLGAQGFEKRGQWSLAALYWERFLQHAVREGMFPQNGAQAARVWFHAATTAAQLSAKNLAHIRRQVQGGQVLPSMYRGQPPHIAALAPKSDTNVTDIALAPDVMFGFSAEMEANAETFEEWFAWGTRSRQPNSRLEKILLLWRQKLPRDPRAPLLLSGLTESRKALKTSLKYLAEAEAIDAMNPAVRKARLRLTLSTAWRHLKERKAHLFEADLAQLQAIAAMQNGDRSLFMRAMGVALLAIGNDPSAALPDADRLVERAGSLLGPALLSFIREIGQLQSLTTWPALAIGIPSDPHTAAEAEARLLALGLELNVAIVRPTEWAPLVAEALKERPSRLSTATLMLLAQAGILRSDFMHAYSATAAGMLTAAGAPLARLLHLRGRCLQHFAVHRAGQCLRVAMALARQANDESLIKEISDTIHSNPWTRDQLADSTRLGDELLAEIIKKEREAATFPLTAFEADKHLVTIESDAGSNRRSGFDEFFGGSNDDDLGAMDDDEDDDMDDEDGPFGRGPHARSVPPELMDMFGGVPTLDDLLELDPALLMQLMSQMTGAQLNDPSMKELAELLANTRGTSRGRGRRKRR
jgi:hypothetical protein